MPFSFVQIEKDKSASIQWSIALLVFFYCFGALLIVAVVKMMLLQGGSGVHRHQISFFQDILNGTTSLWTLISAGVLSAFHWNMSVTGLIDKTVRIMGGRAVDENKDEERIFKNVVEEAGIATGGKHRVTPCIIPTAAMNAFALQDFNGKSVIGITEGLLKRLNREQLEAVIAHEMGHISAGDSLTTSVTMSLFKAFDNVCDVSRMMMNGFSIGNGYRRRSSGDSRFAMIMLVVYLLASLLRFLGMLGSLFISREREYRADAISARLTRNPMALAEALYIINNRWKGGGVPGNGMDAIFILSPRKRAIEDREDVMADLFSTHPPPNRRIGILLEMGHASEKELESALKKAELRSKQFYPDEDKAVLSTGDAAGQKTASVTDRWFIRQQESWQGPFPLGQLQAAGALGLGVPVRKEGASLVTEAQCDKTLNAAMLADPAQKDMCPRCRVPLKEGTYEGESIMACPSCKGVLVFEMNALNILGKRDETFDERIAGLAKMVQEQNALIKRTPFDGVYDEKSIFCPHCLASSPRMVRRFVNPKYLVEIDKCRTCARIWFDADELDILQYLYEQDHPVTKTA